MQLLNTKSYSFLDLLRGKPREHRRRKSRYSLFQAVTLTKQTGENDVVAFTRDISSTGFGLIHDQHLDVQEMQLNVNNLNVNLTVNIGLCHPCGDNWYRSFASLADSSSIMAKKLFFLMAVRRLDPRSFLRHPFFTPVVVSPEPKTNLPLSVFSRDISFSGVGLFHNQPLEECGVWVSVPGREGHLWAKVKWCRPCGNGWYISGAEFDEQSKTELGQIV